MQPALGEIRMFAGNFAPRSWALCQGQLLPISQNQALFSILGTTYGGDGRTTFGLPDMRGRAVVSEGNGPGLTPRHLGAKTGTETNTLNSTQLAQHNHIVVVQNAAASMRVSEATADENSAVGNYLTEINPNPFYASTGGNEAYGGASGNFDIELGNTGASTPINNMGPYLVLNYIICLQGVFPSRS